MSIKSITSLALAAAAAVFISATPAEAIGFTVQTNPSFGYGYAPYYNPYANGNYGYGYGINPWSAGAMPYAYGSPYGGYFNGYFGPHFHYHHHHHGW